MITLIILGIISVFILILILLIVNSIYIKIGSNIDTKDNKPPINETKEFAAGMNHGFSLVLIALYKMWEEQNILDFDSLNEDLKTNVFTITSSPDKFLTWQNKLTEYIKNKNSGEMNG
jgi:hypothetical protein